MGETRLLVHLGAQRLELLDGDRVVREYPISSARNGAGEQEGTEKTPRGRHCVSEKIGDGEPARSVFVGRVPTGEICTPDLASAHPDRDWVLTRILWLDGLEEGRNRGGSVDSKTRYIYIHGTPEEDRLGEPHSHGCIRMRNDHMIELFDAVEVGTPIDIVE